MSLFKEVKQLSKSKEELLFLLQFKEVEKTIKEAAYAGVTSVTFRFLDKRIIDVLEKDGFSVDHTTLETRNNQTFFAYKVSWGD